MCNAILRNHLNHAAWLIFVSRYVYKLCDLHLSIENYTEAAFTLLRRADDLSVSSECSFPGSPLLILILVSMITELKIEERGTRLESGT